MALIKQTTLSGTITASQNQFVVASATDLSAPVNNFRQKIYVLDLGANVGELMTVEALSGTTVTVSRLDENKTAHYTGALVIIAPVDPLKPGFQEFDPATYYATTPLLEFWLNVTTGSQWIWSTLLSRYVPGWCNPNKPQVTAAVASGTSAACTPSGPLFHMTGTSTVTSWVIPVGFNGGSFMTINDGAWQSSAGGNCGSTTVQVATSTTTWTMDAATGVIYCSHLAA